tara:strand:- start:395 stop:589 length:195 start_codon:yes stop_codon:yes gene_type:complete
MMTEKIKKPTKAWRSGKKATHDAEESELLRLQYEVMGLRYCDDCDTPYEYRLNECPTCLQPSQT